MLTPPRSPQGWLGRSEHKLHEGHVQLVRWADALIAWASDRSVTVYDSKAHVQVSKGLEL